LQIGSRKSCGNASKTGWCFLSLFAPPVLAIRAHGRGNTNVLAKHFEPKGVQLPMTIMVLDQQNTAIRVTIDPKGQAHSDFPSTDPEPN
jgi:hypothetical protein